MEFIDSIYEYIYWGSLIAWIGIVIAIIIKRFVSKEKFSGIETTFLTISFIVAFLFVFVYFCVGTQTPIDEKPVIYLYPIKESNISVELGNSDKITCSYPKYINGWNVRAKENGDLIDLDTGKQLYSLYYESNSVVNFKVANEGFCIKGENTAEFLEEKLEILGLNYKEVEEFIIYWLPRLEKNEYNYIRFATEDEINKNMPLRINPEPDTTIRVLMTYKGLRNPIEVKEQNLVQKERIGYTAVEWGGTEITK